MKTTPRAFKVYMVGTFHALAHYDAQGREIFTLADAAREAEEQFGDEWKEVANGDEGVSREEWLESR